MNVDQSFSKDGSTNFMTQRLNALLVLMCAVLVLSACAGPPLYSAKEIRGQIVDEQTGQPIEGAVVVAQWVLFQAGFGDGGHKGRIHVHETVTDKEGRYFIPAWGPRLHPPMTKLLDLDPEILIFKSTYEPHSLYNSAMSEDSMRASDWDGKVVTLRKMQGTLDDYASRIKDGLSTSLSALGEEDWRSFPRMVLALDAEDRRLKSLGLKPEYRSTTFEIHNFNEVDRAFLRKFEK
jgi:hypothetical protein